MNQVRLQISVIDDEETVRKALERLLRSAGMDVDTFPSGKEFIDALPSLQTDCVVLDLHMPGTNGFEVLAHLSQSGKRLPVIVVTGHDTLEARARAQGGGVAAYLLKPVDDCMLLETIAAAVSMDH